MYIFWIIIIVLLIGVVYFNLFLSKTKQKMKLLAESLELKYSKWNNKISGVYKNHELEIYIVNIPNEAAIESDYLFIKMDGKEVHKEYLGLKKDIKEDDYQLKYEVLNKEKIKAVVDNLIT